MLVNRRIFGVNLNSRRNRRWLVVLIYAVLAVPFIDISLNHGGFWESDLESCFLIFPALLINILIFGKLFWGKRYGGLLKPFTPDPARPNDERELAARDSAHYRAYRALLLFILLMVILSIGLSVDIREGLSPMELLFFIRMFLYGLFAITVTLPQAILLWREPDIESEPERQNTLSISRELR